MLDEKRLMWQQCVKFHGHGCGGLAVGYQASLYAMELLDIEMRSEDEEIVCVAETDACGVDAIQVLLGCTLGKGNLLVKNRGKQAFSFYNRNNGSSIRLVLRDTPGKDRDQREHWLMNGDYHEIFDVKKPIVALPEPARIFKSYICTKCKERVSEYHLHLDKGELVCSDCYSHYSRGL